MKKIISLILVLLMAFSLAACNTEEESQTVNVFEDFENAAYSTLSSRVKIETKMATTLGVELKSVIETVSHPDKTTTVTYRIENLNESLDGDPVVVKEGTLTYENGKYTGDAEGVLEGSLADFQVNNINFDESKMEYTISSDVLSVNVKAENVAAVLGIDIGADVSFTLTKSDKKITAFTMDYVLPQGTVNVVCTFN